MGGQHPRVGGAVPSSPWQLPGAAPHEYVLASARLEKNVPPTNTAAPAAAMTRARLDRFTARLRLPDWEMNPDAAVDRACLDTATDRSGGDAAVGRPRNQTAIHRCRFNYYTTYYMNYAGPNVPVKTELRPALVTSQGT